MDWSVGSESESMGEPTGVPSVGSTPAKGIRRAGEELEGPNTAVRNMAATNKCAAEAAWRNLRAQATHKGVSFSPLVYCTTHLEDASAILHVQLGSEASLAFTPDRRISPRGLCLPSSYPTP
eukprot:1214320-Pyramimonas_sp.AAC.1